MKHASDSLVVKQLTAEGKGAIGVLSVSGDGALALVSKVFRPHQGRSLLETPENRLRVGRMGVGVGDEVVVVWWRDLVEVVEIQCHGGPAAVSLVSQALWDELAMQAQPPAGESLEPGIEGAAAADLTRAPTLRTASILLEQSQGVLTKSLHEIATALRKGDDTSASLARHALVHLIEQYESLGSHLLSGWTITLAGRPNVGKSRLMNALAGYERSIVSASEGTTRDIVSIRTAFDGWPVVLNDTAGLRDSVNPVESSGIELARAAQARSTVVLLLLDGSRPLVPEDWKLLEQLPARLIVKTKCDLPMAWSNDFEPAVTISAATGEGLPELIRLLSRGIVPEPPEVGAPIPFRESQAHFLRTVVNMLDTRGASQAANELERYVGLGR